MWDSSQSSEWAFTPPDSPGSKYEREEKEIELKPTSFHCLGQVSRGNHDFHADGFLKSISITNCDVDSKGITKVKLFNSRYSFWTALENEIDILFNLCRKNFMLLHSRIKENSLGLIKENTRNAISSASLRKNVNLFLAYIYTFIKSSLCYYDKSEKLDSILPRIEEKLRMLQLLFQRLSFAYLPDHITLYFYSTQGSKSSNPAYHLIHCHLDVRWLCLKISEEMQKAKNKEEHNTLTQFVTHPDSFTINDNDLLVMSELTWLSIVKFEKTESNCVSQSPAFACSCVKELWVLLIHFLGKTEFWRHFNQILTTVLDKTDPPTDFTPNCSSFRIPEYYDCSNRPQCSLWILYNVAKLYEYDKEGFHVGRNNDVEPNFIVFDDIVKRFINSEPSEGSLRNYLPLIFSILNLWSHGKSDSVILLLEYYLKKLNCAFYNAGNKLDEIVVCSPTAQGFLQQIKDRLDLTKELNRNENSFSMFLRLLGTHLDKCKLKSLSNKLSSRIFVQFSPGKLDKVLELSELGLYHLSSLYLTLALVKDVESIVRRLQSLMTALPRKKLTPAKQAIVWKSLTASLILLTEKKCDIAESSELILREISTVLTEEDVTNMPIFTEGLKIILESCNPQASALIGDWIEKYLKICSRGDADRLFLIFSKVVQKLRLEINSWSLEHANEFKEKLIKHVFPFVNNQISPAAADLATSFVLLFAEYQSNRSELVALHNFWSNCNDVKLSSRYLCSLLFDNAKDELKVIFPNYQTDVIQCWIRSSLLFKSSPETVELTEIAISLPPVNQFFKDSNSMDHLTVLINGFGSSYDKAQTLDEKQKIRDQFLTCFSKLDKWIQEEMKKIEELSKQTIDDLYRYSSLLILKCGYLIYTKSNPQSLIKTIIDNLLLPPQIFKMKGFMLTASQNSAIFNYLDNFINGLIKLRPDRDAYVQSTLQNLIVQYLPRLFNKCSDGNILRNPVYRVVYKNEEAAVLIFKIIAKEFLDVKNNELHPHSCNAIRLISEASKSSSGKRIFETVIGSILNLIMFSKEHHEARGESLSYIRSFINVPDNRRHLMKNIKTMNERHLSFSSKQWFGLLFVLTPICGDELNSFLPEIEDEIKKVEKKRGIERDSSLRSFLQQLRNRLQR